MNIGTGGFNIVDLHGIHRLRYYATLPESYDDIEFRQVDGLLEAVKATFEGKPLMFTGYGDVIPGAQIIPQIPEEIYRRINWDVNLYVVRLFYCHPDGSTRGADVSLVVTEDGAFFTAYYF